MLHGTRRMTTGTTAGEVIADMRIRTAENLNIDADRIRYVRSDQPGQFGETDWRWEILYQDQWRELPWHFDGPLPADQDSKRKLSRATRLSTGLWTKMLQLFFIASGLRFWKLAVSLTSSFHGCRSESC